MCVCNTVLKSLNVSNDNFTFNNTCIKITFKLHKCIKDGNVNKQWWWSFLTMILTHNQLFMPRSQLYWWYFIWFVHLMMILAIILKIMSDQNRRFQLKVYQEQIYSLSSLWNPNDLLPETQRLQRDCTHTADTGNLSRSSHVGHTPHNALRWLFFFLLMQHRGIGEKSCSFSLKEHLR